MSGAPLSIDTRSDAPSWAETGPFYGAPSYAGGGVWNVATSGSRADNTGSASAGVPADKMDQYIQWAVIGLGLVIAWKMLKTKKR